MARTRLVGLASSDVYWCVLLSSSCDGLNLAWYSWFIQGPDMSECECSLLYTYSIVGQAIKMVNHKHGIHLCGIPLRIHSFYCPKMLSVLYRKVKVHSFCYFPMILFKYGNLKLLQQLTDSVLTSSVFTTWPILEVLVRLCHVLEPVSDSLTFWTWHFDIRLILSQTVCRQRSWTRTY